MRKIVVAVFVALAAAVALGPGAFAAYNCQVRAAGQKYSSCKAITKSVVMIGAKCLPDTNPQKCGGSCTPTVASDCNPSSCEPACRNSECNVTCNAATEYVDVASNTCKPIIIAGPADFARCVKCTSKSDMTNCLANKSLSC